MRDWVRRVFSTNTTDSGIGFGLLWLRVMIGLFLFSFHGWGKLSTFATRMDTFGDPLGIGSPLSLTLATFAEAICSLALVLGLGTRAVAVPMLITMLVAAGIVHLDDPWNKKEFALLYAIPLVTLIFTGGGKFSLDAKILRRFL